ncbi:hypothetical protein PC117_g28375 [Phytophthora cactorum]|uniref:Uncharacterized protein n=1 Tax=Phytophthora cactorum TaxID=29920 RepID=A0A8T1A2W5_9STRA|nr:hypothetical protein PC117_g28375 [Phytophthora cactorum]
MFGTYSAFLISISRSSPLGRTTRSTMVPTPMMAALLPSATESSPSFRSIKWANLALSLQMWCVAPLSTAHIPDTFLPVEIPHSRETANATRS